MGALLDLRAARKIWIAGKSVRRLWVDGESWSAPVVPGFEHVAMRFSQAESTVRGWSNFPTTGKTGLFAIRFLYDPDASLRGGVLNVRDNMFVRQDSSSGVLRVAVNTRAMSGGAPSGRRLCYQDVPVTKGDVVTAVGVFGGIDGGRPRQSVAVLVNGAAVSTTGPSVIDVSGAEFNSSDANALVSDMRLGGRAGPWTAARCTHDQFRTVVAVDPVSVPANAAELLELFAPGGGELASPTVLYGAIGGRPQIDFFQWANHGTGGAADVVVGGM